MRTLLLLAALAAPAAAHPHEWVDWGAGLVLDDKNPSLVDSLVLELAWDELFSAVMLTDFPGIQKNALTPAELAQLNTAYGLASPDRALSLSVSFAGRPVPVKLVITGTRFDGNRVTLVYRVPLGLRVSAPTQLKVEMYDPTYYTDMGIRAKDSAFFIGVKDPAHQGSFSLQQDLAHPYYSGMVYPELVVFTLRP